MFNFKFIIILILILLIILFLIAAGVIIWFILTEEKVGLSPESKTESSIEAEPESKDNYGTAAICGNKIKEGGEQCDWGENNSDFKPDFCRTNCQLARCGDGMLDINEECDFGESNSNFPNASCRADCKLPKCGDGIIDDFYLNEECDDGNMSNNDYCSVNCQIQIKELCWQGSDELLVKSNVLAFFNDSSNCANPAEENGKGYVSKSEASFQMNSWQKAQLKKFCKCVTGEYYYYDWDGHCYYGWEGYSIGLYTNLIVAVPGEEPNQWHSIAKQYKDFGDNENYKREVLFSSDKSFWSINKVSCFPGEYWTTDQNYWHFK